MRHSRKHKSYRMALLIGRMGSWRYKAMPKRSRVAVWLCGLSAKGKDFSRQGVVAAPSPNYSESKESRPGLDLDGPRFGATVNFVGWPGWDGVVRQTIRMGLH